jgi:hypothetical protein
VADAPWRCSQCGTINEPVANSCRACGRWPSLFDLEASTLDDPADVAEPVFEPAPYEPDPVDMRGEIPAEPPLVEPLPDEVEPLPEDDAEPQGPTWRRILTSAIVPIAFVVYLLISIFFGDQS